MTHSAMRTLMRSLTMSSIGFGALTAFAQHNTKTRPEEFAPFKACGVLGVCNGGEKIFMYTCKDDDVVIRLCGEGSSYESASQDHCVGPEKSVSKSNFKDFIKNQISKQDLQEKLDPITVEDVAASKPDGDMSEARDCSKQTENKIAKLKNKLAKLEGAISKVVKLNIEEQIKDLKSDLQKSHSKVAACVKKDSAIKKIDNQIEGAVATVCAKDGVHVPKEGSFLHTILSQYDPWKHPCSSEKECQTEIKLKDGTVVGSVVSRNVSHSGVVEEYRKDKASGLTWSPEAPEKMDWDQAKAYCESKTDLGLKWHLPSQDDFRVAFHPNNSDKKKASFFDERLDERLNEAAAKRGWPQEPKYYFVNIRLLEALDTKDRYLWSSSKKDPFSAWGFEGYEGSITPSYQDRRHSVRCVSL